MSTPAEFPFRQIHLDFHTSPLVEGIGAAFDADEFGDTLARANVSSVTVFAKCHHGMSYYPTKIGTPHPHLDFDLLGAQIEACHARGIRAPIYVTVVWEQQSGMEHPEWLQRTPDGGTYGDWPEGPAWTWLSMAASGYCDRLVAETEEILERYGDAVDGFFFDILMTGSEGDCHPEAVAARERRGLPDTVAGRKENDVEVARDLMRRLTTVIRARRPDASLFFNSRFGLDFRDEQDLYSQVEVEALPTGMWGYGYYPLWSRYGRRFDLPMLGMTGRFHLGWADFGGLKTVDALLYECGGTLANGGGVSIGDQLHPDGRLDAAVYDVIGEAFADVRAKEPWVRGAKPLTEVALLVGHGESANRGAARMLLEAHHAFDALDEGDDFSPYRALVVTEAVPSSPELTGKLEAYVAEGGALLIAGPASAGTVDAADVVGPRRSHPTYFHPSTDLMTDLRDFEYVVYGQSDELALRDGGQTLAVAHDAMFTRTVAHFTSHLHAPAERTANGAFVARRGQVVRLAGPVFSGYDLYGNVAFRSLAMNALALLVPDPLIETDAPATVEVSVSRLGESVVTQFSHYQSARPSEAISVIDRIAPVGPIFVGLRIDGEFEASERPSGRPLTTRSEGGRIYFELPSLGAHAMVELRPRGV